MPSHTAASAFIKLFFFEDAGHPWDWSVWQDLTNIHHGLFPTDDKHLLTGWSRKDANDILSYFRMYQAQPTEEAKIKFATSTHGGVAPPGRKKWSAFITKSWEKWKIHSIVVEALNDHNINPVTLLNAQGGNLETAWPLADIYLPLAVDTVGLALFGIEAFGDAPLLPQDIRKSLTIMMQRSWSRMRKQIKSDLKRLPEIEEAAIEAFNGE